MRPVDGAFPWISKGRGSIQRTRPTSQNPTPLEKGCARQIRRQLLGRRSRGELRNSTCRERKPLRVDRPSP